MKNIIVGAFAFAALSFAVVPAFAADFFVVQDTTSMKCSVVGAKPTASTMKAVGDGKSYATQADADTAMAKATVCASK